MSRLCRSNSIASGSSRSSLNRIPDIVNEDQFEYQSNDNVDFNEWNIPKVPSNKIYIKKNWSIASFKSEHHVKTVEQVYALSKQHETCQLFSPESIKKHRKDGHNFLHIGLVQIGVKPLTRRGLNASVLLCLRDARFTNFGDSTLGIIESSLVNGPIHFDCYPDFTVSLSDQHILKALTLNIKTAGYNVLEGTQPLALVYRVHYKVTGTNMNFQAINKSPKDQTLLIQSTHGNANIRVPHTIKWSDITLPTEWSLTYESQPVNIQNSLSDIECIQQDSNGTVKINFSNPIPKSNIRIQELAQSSRHSFADSASLENLSRRDFDLDREIKNIRIKELEEELKKLKIKTIKTASQVSYPTYATTSNTQQEEE